MENPLYRGRAGVTFLLGDACARWARAWSSGPGDRVKKGRGTALAVPLPFIFRAQGYTGCCVFFSIISKMTRSVSVMPGLLMRPMLAIEASAVSPTTPSVVAAATPSMAR